MKILFTLSFYLVSISALCLGTAYGQEFEKFEIKGVGKKTTEKAYLIYYSFNDEEKISDSTVIKGDKFSFKGKIEGPSYGGVVFGNSFKEASANWGDPKNIWFMIFEGETQISFANDVPKVIGRNKGMDIENAFSEVKKARRSELRGEAYNADKLKIIELKQEVGQLEAAFVQKYGTEEDLEYGAISDFLKNNSTNKYSLYLLRGYLQGDKRDFEKSSKLYESLGDNLKNSTLGKKLGHLINTFKIKKGSEAFAFSQADPNGKQISLADFKGKYVLVDFWASWCVPCRGENPNVVKAYEMFKNKNFEIIGVSLDSKKENWLEAIKADNLTWPQVSDLKGWKNEVAVLYGVRAIPENFLIDPTGKIIAKDLREEKLIEVLSEVLK